MSTPGSIVLVEGTADVALPPVGKLALYSKSDDGLYTINSSGTVVGPLSAGGGGGTPGGPGNSVQYNNTTFGGSAKFLFDPTGSSGHGFSPGGPLLSLAKNNGDSGVPTMEFGTHNGSSTNDANSMYLYNDGFPNLQIYNGGLVVTGNASPGIIKASADISTVTPGFGFRAAEGSDAKQGIATLVAGTVTVANASVTANSRIFLTGQDDNGGTPGWIRVSARNPGTDFTITSSDPADTSIVAYEIFEPA